MSEIKKTKSKRINSDTARMRYWSSGRMRARKIRNLMKHNGLSETEAIELWDKTRIRKGR